MELWCAENGNFKMELLYLSMISLYQCLQFVVTSRQENDWKHHLLMESKQSSNKVQTKFISPTLLIMAFLPFGHNQAKF